ncbi:GPI transamidase component PIG-T [Mycotypha africana]|uniref:GPI transamidase component PIG-T n=1 Tax=Mycotypha africana TaxID=64632 RepID=UPI0023007D89|nr:GPI transamidase component PIG-T [Mycotypha africana]KAI8984284.1 GPI transamidase component PIG-T [Mycotypha africana]
MQAKILLGLLLSIYGINCQISTQDVKETYNEKLTLRNLPDGKLLAHFSFTTTVHVETEPNAPILDYGLYPKAIGQVLQTINVTDMHLSFTQGRWNYEEWGYPPSISASTGVEMWAWMRDNSHENVDKQWKLLTNTLSGLFCASLNFIDETITTQPKLSFQSNGDVEEESGAQLRYGALPQENVCTENLTPWLKLLPCKSKSGISVLLNPHKIYNSNFHSMAIHAKSKCADSECTERILEIEQTITSVMDPVRDTGRRDWSLESIFERQLENACPVATESKVVVELEDAGNDFELKPVTITADTEGKNKVATYHLSSSKEPLDIRMTWNQENSFLYPLKPVRPMIYAERYFTGYGQERGGLKITIYNRNGETSMPVIYYDSIPWYLKLYLHTLKVDVFSLQNGSLLNEEDGGVIQEMYYQPAIDRGRPTVLECNLLLPANSVTTLSMDFEKVFLKYTEHRPDANRGFDIGSAVLTAWIPDVNQQGLILQGEPQRVYTDTLLVRLPTPDFSMPYNVITLTCTVIALFFGSIFNLLIRNFSVINPPAEEEKNKKKQQQ